MAKRKRQEKPTLKVFTQDGERVDARQRLLDDNKRLLEEGRTRLVQLLRHLADEVASAPDDKVFQLLSNLSDKLPDYA